ncbi:trigger factor [Borrelia hermsii]|uniref:Trigger factor n=3 Tax=Borrelia hermsii TaxID=140 RepID=TIG_BORHD|nr:trigger factor [Borrelia hermsii]B2S0V7.1 RecName: Full=Trigger factor; Short=TF; AltName: Full=PPIase [Borrelia hermsii DAH]AAX17113.1 trigger factor, ppiase [Borrelia hermsii DAH]AMR75245.1 Trigger factor, ppiase [Borrelia hermsii]ANA43411.1 trigger factor [Borrelia hermsii HS1]UPA07916.1 trigger factor [Borrelia hermsii DAH]
MILNDDVKLIPGSKVEAVIKISKEFVKGKYNEILQDYSSRLKIKGFRIGKVPFSIIEGKYSDNIRALTIEKLIHKSLEEFFKSATYKPLGYAVPKILDEKLEIDFNKDFEFTVVYEAYPEFEIPDISNVEVEIPEVTVSDSDVEDELKLLQLENAMVVDDSGDVKVGSIVRVDFVELDDSLSEILTTKRQDFVFTVGESNNYYGFDNDIIGMKKDEEKIIEKNYSADYKFSELANSFKRLKIIIKDIKKRDIPELDDDFAKDIKDSFNTLEELKAHIRENMLRLVKEKRESLKLSKLLSDVSEKLNIEIPSAMFEAELKNVVNEFSTQNKIDLKKLNDSSMGLEGVSDVFKENVLKKLKSKLVFQKIVDNDLTEITDADLEDELVKQAEDTKMRLSEIKKFYQEKNLLGILKDEIKRQKVKDKILKNVKEIKLKEIAFRDFINYKTGE